MDIKTESKYGVTSKIIQYNILNGTKLIIVNYFTFHLRFRKIRSPYIANRFTDP